MPSKLDNVLQCLSLNGYSVFSLIDDILACRNWEDESIKLLREGMERDAADICARLLCFDSVPKRVLKYGSVQFKIRRRAVPIDMLPDNVFLEIFDFCLRDPTIFSIQRAKKWQALVHVCQRWRRIIFSSPNRLALHLSCTYGTPVRKGLSLWPATLPLTIDYPFFDSDRVLGDEDNIVAALEHHNRVHRIVIRAAGSLFSEVATIMQKSFPALQHLELEWDLTESDTAAPYSGGFPVPGRFLGGSAPRLQHLHLKCISFPQLPTFLLSAHNLVTLELKSISQNDYISTEVIVRSLAALTRLKTLSITFYDDDDDISPPDQNESRSRLPMRVTLPALTEFRYEGYCDYLENVLAQLNTPQLNNLRIEYFPDEIEAPQLSQFLDRTASLKLNQFRHAEVIFYPMAITVKLDHSQECHQAQLFLDILEVPGLDEQVPCVVDVLGQLVAMFPNLDHLSSHGDNIDPTKMESTDWLPFFHLFQAVKALHLSGGVAAYIVSALEDTTNGMVADVLPALDLIWIDEEENEDCDEPVGSIKRFLSLRQLSGRPVTVVDTEDEFLEADRNPLYSGDN
ncbi:hypothetical protein V8E53_011132 [Lactarius tabidus]